LFSGLIEEMGQVLEIKHGSEEAYINIAAKKVLEGCAIGDSIAVNGVCLTVTSMGKDSFTADIMNTTLTKSNLGKLGSGSGVNLERAMALGERLGGHLVSGHIDGVGKIVSMEKQGIALLIEIIPPSDLLPYLINQGSVALDGISLTVAQKKKESFIVSLIPHTAGQTTLAMKKTGDSVNIETDMIAKYVESLMVTPKQKESKLDTTFLAEHGFL